MTAWSGLGEAVRAHPGGASTAARLAMTAAQIGFDGLVLRNADDLPDAPTLEEIGEAYGIGVSHGVELTAAEPGPVSGRLPGLAERTSVLMVAGGSERMNRFVASQPHVDVLTRPVGPDGPDIDPGVATAAVEHGVAIELDLGPLRGRGGERVRYIDRLRRLWRVVDHFGVPYVVTGAPESHLELVAPRELVALGGLVGIDPDAMRTGLAGWLDVAGDGP